MKKIITILILTLIASIGFAKAKIHCIDKMETDNGIKSCTLSDKATKDKDGKTETEIILGLTIFPNNHYSIIAITMTTNGIASSTIDLGNDFNADYELN